MNRTEILVTAEKLITRDRREVYGDDSFGVIASYWSTHLDHPVSATDVPIMMALLKLARAKAARAHADSYVDAAGYIALGGEMAGGE